MYSDIRFVDSVSPYFTVHLRAFDVLYVYMCVFVKIERVRMGH